MAARVTALRSRNGEINRHEVAIGRVVSSLERGILRPWRWLARGSRRLRGSGRLRVPASRGAQLLAASGFALAQPLFSLARQERGVLRGARPGAGRHRRVRARRDVRARAGCCSPFEFVAGALSALPGFVSAPRLSRFPRRGLRRAGAQARAWNGTVALSAAPSLIGAAIALAVWRLPPARSFLNVLAAAPVVFLCLVPAATRRPDSW